VTKKDIKVCEPREPARHTHTPTHNILPRHENNNDDDDDDDDIF